MFRAVSGLGDGSNKLIIIGMNAIYFVLGRAKLPKSGHIEFTGLLLMLSALLGGDLMLNC